MLLCWCEMLGSGTYWTLITLRLLVGHGHGLNSYYSEVTACGWTCTELLWLCRDRFGSLLSWTDVTVTWQFGQGLYWTFLWCGDMRGRGTYWNHVTVTFLVRECHVINYCYREVTGCGGACTERLFCWRDRLVRVMYWTVVLLRWQNEDEHVMNCCYGDMTYRGGECSELVLLWLYSLGRGMYKLLV
jgi:hypothetical protein